jgi:hypothetical protein
MRILIGIFQVAGEGVERRQFQTAQKELDVGMFQVCKQGF